MAITYDFIASTSANGVNQMSFTSIPQTYTDLVVVVYNLTVNQGDGWYYRFNNDATANAYNLESLAGTGTTVSKIYDLNNYFFSTQIQGAGTNSSYPSVGIFQVNRYTDTSYWKPCFFISGSTTPTAFAFDYNTGIWASASAITSIQIGTAGTVTLSNTKATLYGIKAA